VFHSKRLLAKRTVQKKLTVSDFAGGQNSVLDDAYIDASVAKVSYNVKGESGALKEYGGVSPLMLPLGDGTFLEASLDSYKIKKIWYYRRTDPYSKANDDRIILLSDKLRLYCIYVNKLINGIVCFDSRVFNDVPDALNYRLNGEDVMIFSSARDSMRIYYGTGTPLIYENNFGFCQMCIHSDRLFALKKQEEKTLFFSDDLDPSNFNISLEEGGYINMTDDRGALLKTVSFLNYLYIFRSYGISRLTAYGPQQNFCLNHLFTAGAKIYPDTITVCGDKILFLSGEGLFSFDGNSAKKILNRLDGYFEGNDNTHACAAYLNGKYYLTCNLNFGDEITTPAETAGCVNNALIEVDILSGAVSILRGFDAEGLIGVTGGAFNNLMMCFGANQPHANTVGVFDNGGKIFGQNSVKRWICPLSDLNSPTVKKKLTHIFLTSHFDVDLKVTADGIDYAFFVKGSLSAQKIPINLTGETFRLTVTGNTEKLYVLRPQLIFKEYT
jgi:hypothetical protein